MPQFQITSPEGKKYKITAPEGATKEQAFEYFKSQYGAKTSQAEEGISTPNTTPEVEKGFFSRVGEDLEKRYGMAKISAKEAALGKQTTSENILQTTGQVAGLGMDVIGEGLVSAVKYLSDVTPDAIEEPVVKFAKESLSKIADSDIGRKGIEALSKGVETYQEFAKENPRAARNIEAVANIGLFLAPVPTGKTKAPAKETILGKIGTKLDDLAGEQVKKRKEAFVEKLLEPMTTKTIRQERVGRSIETGGLLGGRKVVPTGKEKAVADELLNIPVSSKNTLLGNQNIIKSEISKEALNLEKELAKNNVLFPKREIKAKLRGVIDQLRTEQPLIVGDAAKSAERIYAKANQLLDQNPANATGLLNVRKELDKFVKNATKTVSGKTAVFDEGGRETAIKIANQEIRNTLNDFLAEKATNVAVKQSLKKQSNLFRALDVVTPKAAEEAATRFGRAIESLSKIIPIKNETASLLALGAGGTAAGAVAAAAPIATAIGATGYGGYKALTSVKGKKIAGRILNKLDDVIRKTKDKNVLNELKLNRAAILQIIEEQEKEND